MLGLSSTPTARSPKRSLKRRGGGTKWLRINALCSHDIRLHVLGPADDGARQKDAMEGARRRMDVGSATFANVHFSGFVDVWRGGFWAWGRSPTPRRRRG